jgi:acyl dehydratase
LVLAAGGSVTQRYTATDLEPVFFEDLPLGAEWTTRGRTLTEADVSAFAGLAGDFNPLHVDADYARATHFAGKVVQGSFLAAAAIGLGSMDVPVPATVGMVGMTWRFLLPVRPGESIRARWRLARKRSVENPNWGLTVWQVHILNAAGQEVAEGEVARLVARREDQRADEAAPAPGRRRRRGRRLPADAAAMAEPMDLEAAPAEVAELAPVVAPSRRRRGRRTTAPSEPAAPAVPAAALEPPAAPVAPASSRRRRGRRQPAASAAPDAPVGEPSPVAEAPPAAAPASPSSSSRRRRRRRGGNGGSSNGSGSAAGGGGAKPAAGAEPAKPVPEPAAPLYGQAAAQALASVPTAAPRALGRALRRLRGSPG